jgi:hypothetical protein
MAKNVLAFCRPFAGELRTMALSEAARASERVSPILVTVGIVEDPPGDEPLTERVEVLAPALGGAARSSCRFSGCFGAGIFTSHCGVAPPLGSWKLSLNGAGPSGFCADRALRTRRQVARQCIAPLATLCIFSSA